MNLFKKRNNNNNTSKLPNIIINQKTSMKHWLIVIIVVIAIFLIVGFLHDQGLLNVKWQGLAILIAIIAGPYKLLKNYLTGGSKKTDKIIDKHLKIEAEEKIHRKEYDEKIIEKEEKIQELEKEIIYLDKKIEKVEKKKKNVYKEVEKMDLDEVQNEFADLYGD